MKYLKESSIICFGDTKAAALYFNKVLPISYMFSEMFQSIDLNDFRIDNHGNRMPLNVDDVNKLIKKKKIHPLCSEVLDDLMGDFSIKSQRFKHTMELFDNHINLILLNIRKAEIEDRIDEIPKAVRDLYQKLNLFLKESNMIDLDIYMKNLFKLLVVHYYEDIELWGCERSLRSDISALSKIWTNNSDNILMPSFCFENNTGTDTDVTFSLLNVNLIDTSKISWKKLLDFRKDVSSRNKLRNLKLFLYQNYDGKSLSYIEDDIFRKIDDYNSVCKDWEFETITSFLSMVTNSKTIYGSIFGSIASLLYGETALTIASATPSLMKIANITIEVAKKKYAFYKIKRDHNLAYIIEAKEKLLSA